MAFNPYEGSIPHPFFGNNHLNGIPSLMIGMDIVPNFGALPRELRIVAELDNNVPIGTYSLPPYQRLEEVMVEEKTAENDKKIEMDEQKKEEEATTEAGKDEKGKKVELNSVIPPAIHKTWPTFPVIGDVDIQEFLESHVDFKVHFTFAIYRKPGNMFLDEDGFKKPIGRAPRRKFKTTMNAFKKNSGGKKTEPKYDRNRCVPSVMVGMQILPNFGVLPEHKKRYAEVIMSVAPGTFSKFPFNCEPWVGAKDWNDCQIQNEFAVLSGIMPMRMAELENDIDIISVFSSDISDETLENSREITPVPMETDEKPNMPKSLGVVQKEEMVKEPEMIQKPKVAEKQTMVKKQEMPKEPELGKKPEVIAEKVFSDAEKIKKLEAEIACLKTINGELLSHKQQCLMWILSSISYYETRIKEGVTVEIMKDVMENTFRQLTTPAGRADFMKLITKTFNLPKKGNQDVPKKD